MEKKCILLHHREKHVVALSLHWVAHAERKKNASFSVNVKNMWSLLLLVCTYREKNRILLNPREKQMVALTQHWAVHTEKIEMHPHPPMTVETHRGFELGSALGCTHTHTHK